MTESLFKTERLQVAVFLHSTQLLRFVGIEESRPGRSTFIFADPDHKGDEYEFNFNRGAHVAATALFASQTFLRRSMTQRTESHNTKPGDRNDHRSIHATTR